MVQSGGVFLAALAVACVAASVSGSIYYYPSSTAAPYSPYRYSYYRALGMPDPCYPNPCGRNAQCREVNARPVCSCLPGHQGNPLTYCQRGECQDSSDCPHNRKCQNYECVDACAGTCGINAHCEVRNHIPVCSCPPQHTGDPISSCRRMDPQELCTSTTCGAHTRCDVINLVPTCSCLPGYKGSPLNGCHHECEADADCGRGQQCRDFTCQAACTAGTCGDNANCEVRNHRAVCSCPAGYLGDPYVSCRAECLSHGDCPRDRPSCVAARCTNPCLGVCGVNADCKVRDATAICSCPRDMTGDPFVSCRPFEKRDLCDPNPCGENAQCQPGYDRSGKDRPVCTCLPGYKGDPLSYCRRGECSSSSDCGNHQACLNYECRDACAGQCGVNADCRARDHVAVCTCPPGFTGDAVTQCTALPQARGADSYVSGRSGGYWRYGRYYY
ncbi:Neurogenic locus notch-like protein 1 [Frankliniella fusca]|uniref:Neurogenic locus notch-like protein 1 n=1 Tax=Frankliniella fusca TaxID=407009 RepID=A0AAE1LBJ5_9NEOP|nr:Neurogenic locus notch-like protein 1 [Frankliniella fusca]